MILENYITRHNVNVKPGILFLLLSLRLIYFPTINYFESGKTIYLLLLISLALTVFKLKEATSWTIPYTYVPTGRTWKLLFVLYFSQQLPKTFSKFKCLQRNILLVFFWRLNPHLICTYVHTICTILKGG
jgi:hypothetical protein